MYQNWDAITDSDGNVDTPLVSFVSSGRFQINVVDVDGSNVTPIVLRPAFGAPGGQQYFCENTNAQYDADSAPANVYLTREDVTITVSGTDFTADFVAEQLPAGDIGAATTLINNHTTTQVTNIEFDQTTQTNTLLGAIEESAFL